MDEWTSPYPRQYNNSEKDSGMTPGILDTMLKGAVNESLSLTAPLLY
jgi:hypothetical protein